MIRQNHLGSMDLLKGFLYREWVEIQRQYQVINNDYN